jgi:hypothetical protein
MTFRLSPTFAGLAAFAFASAALAQSAALAPVRAVPTYEAAGLYWSAPSGAGNAGCDVRYRRAGDSAWSNGLALWYDASANECRGSIVGLAAGTAYEAQLGVGGNFSQSLSFATWANAKPVASTVKVPGGTATVNVTSGGSAAGWVVYDGGGAVIDGQNSAQYNITVNASYVIVRNFVLKGAKQDAIRISPNVTDVVIEDNDISGWGRTRDGTWGTDMDSGIRAVCSAETLTRVTIQRNRIHDPRYPANSWSDGHPAGPQGITFSYCGGNNVFRWNEIFSSKNHFNDGMGGEDNFSTTGFPNRDSDVYGNRIEMTWDDALEIEGGNVNVRVWGNYMNNTATGIASTVTSIGPLYVFRNVYNRSRFYEKIASTDSDDRQPMFKSGSSSSFGNGRRYLFHNTMLQATQAGLQYPLGGGAGVGGTGDTQLVQNTVSMNNIYHIWKPNSAVYQVGTTNTFQNDLFNGRMDTAIVGGIKATPQYAAGNGWQSESGGMYQLAAGTPGYDGGVRIANFNDGFLGAAPDVGAAEAGAGPMRFGLAAANASTSAGTPAPTAPPTAPTPTPPTTGGTGTASVSATMDASRYTLGAGESVTLTAAFMGNAGAPTGTVTFMDNGAAIGGCSAVAIANGKAACTTAAMAAGAHPVSGSYSGDAVYGKGVAGPITLSVSGTSAPPATTTSVDTIIAHYYEAILHRAPDPSGATYWRSEAARLASLGANVNEVFYAMATTFFASGEYAGLRRDNDGYMTDLYNAFFNRAPDPGGLAYWTGLLGSGMPREIVLVTFMFSPEFTAYVQGAVGSTSVRMEIDTVMDLYRGLLARLPDASGFGYWLQRFRTAQCQGAGAVYAQVDGVTNEFLQSTEYALKGRTNAQFVGDLYNAVLRRGGDPSGAQFWVDQLDRGLTTRDAVRRAFIASPEFTNRVNAIVAAGCAG